LTIAEDDNSHCGGEGIDYGGADTVKTARYFICGSIELASGVKLGHGYL
jgi:hypothetical protein